MAAKNAQKVAAKWKERLSNATEEMTDGVRAVTVAPGVQAAAKQETMKARLMEAITSGKWARNVQKKSLSEWQADMINVGIPRVSQGAAEKIGKVEKFMTKFLPFVEGVSKQIKAMPNATKADRKARMNKNFDLMSEFANT